LRVAIYTFYCCRPDGSAPSFEVYDLPSDEAAAHRALALLGTHPSAAHIAVCQDDRELLVQRRERLAASA
jgi:hypothetical protein